MGLVKMQKILLLCEGTESAADSVVLQKLCGKIVRVVPVGSRFGMKHRIEVLRKVQDFPAYAILDRDFPQKWESQSCLPIPWMTQENSISKCYGWYWERKEIENYLIDPIVVRESLGESVFDWNEYTDALKIARDKISSYQAARLTLSVLGRTGQYYVASSKGVHRGSSDHYRFPEEGQLDEVTCDEWIASTHAEYENRHLSRFNSLDNLYHQYRIECNEGGIRFENYMAAFSGKDIAWCLNGWLRKKGFQGTKHFLNSILEGIAGSKTDITQWLFEWNRFYSVVVQRVSSAALVQPVSSKPKPQVSDAISGENSETDQVDNVIEK